MKLSPKLYFQSFFDRCPGALLGNHPEPEHAGNIVINSHLIMEAITAIRKCKHFSIAYTTVYEEPNQTPAVMFGLEWVP
jgi:hypothetical protein